MIPLDFKPINPSEVDKLRKWLLDPAADIALGVIEAALAKCASKAGTLMVLAQNDPAELVEAETQAKAGQEAKAVLDLLRAMREGKYLFSNTDFEYERATLGNYGD